MTEPAGIQERERLRKRKPLTDVVIQRLLKIAPEPALFAVDEPTAFVENRVEIAQLPRQRGIRLAADELCEIRAADSVHRSSPSLCR